MELHATACSHEKGLGLCHIQQDLMHACRCRIREGGIGCICTVCDTEGHRAGHSVVVQGMDVYPPHPSTQSLETCPVGPTESIGVAMPVVDCIKCESPVPEQGSNQLAVPLE